MKIIKLKKKISVFILTLTFIAGGSQVYASTVLNTNIISLISSGINSLKDYFNNNDVKNEVDTMNTQYTKATGDYVTQKSQQIINDLTTHKTNEINRAKQELQLEFQSMQGQVDAQVNSEVKKAKDSITSNVNQNIDKVKQNMYSELQQQIQQQFSQMYKNIQNK